MNIIGGGGGELVAGVHESALVQKEPPAVEGRVPLSVVRHTPPQLINSHLLSFMRLVHLRKTAKHPNRK